MVGFRNLRFGDRFILESLFGFKLPEFCKPVVVFRSIVPSAVLQIKPSDLSARFKQRNVHRGLSNSDVLDL